MWFVLEKSMFLTLFCVVFELINKWDPYVRCAGLEIHWILLREKMNLDYLLAQIR